MSKLVQNINIKFVSNVRLHFNTSREQDPTTVSSIWLGFYSELMGLGLMVSKAFNEQFEQKTRAAKVRSATISKDKFMQDVHNLFAERMQFLPPKIDLGWKETVFVLTKLIFKVALKS